MEHYLKGVPLHDPRRLYFYTPKDFRKVLEDYPLDLKYLDWLKEQGYSLVFRDTLPNSLRGHVLFDLKRIEIATNGESSEGLDLILAHEIVHTAIPDARTTIEAADFYPLLFLRRFEGIICEFAQKYAQDKVFMDYAKQVLTCNKSLEM